MQIQFPLRANNIYLFYLNYYYYYKLNLELSINFINFSLISVIHFNLIFHFQFINNNL